MGNVISCQIFDNLLANNVFRPQQHGFFMDKSTYTNLLESLNNWTFSIQYERFNICVYRFQRSFVHYYP